MKRILSLTLFLFAVWQSALADNYYWVNNGGNWTDVSHHWSKSSGDTVNMQSVIPGPNDTVYFDANSFTQSGQSVNLDIPVAECAMMDWSGISFNIYFFSGNSDTLKIYGSCILSNNLNFNFYGVLVFMSPPAQVSDLDFANKVLACDIVLSSDSVRLLSRLYMPYNQLSLVDGSLFTNGHSVTCQHFNTDSTLKNSIPVANPKWFSNDTLTIRGSMALSDSLDFLQNGPVYFAYNSLDTNYFNLYLNTLPGKVIFNGSKNMFLRSGLSVAGSIEITGGGKFYSKGYPLNCAAFTSATPLTRTINLSTSLITLNAPGNALNFQSQGLTLKADSAIIAFNYSGNDTVIIRTGKDTNNISIFKEIHLPSSNAMIFNSFNTSLLAFGTGSNIALATSITITLDSISSAGDCGRYNYIKAFCPSCIQCENVQGCGTLLPNFDFNYPDTTDYLKLSNIKASGNPVANNSFDEGNNTGWTINEPATPPTLYWVGGSGNWNDPDQWSAVSGGTAHSCIPTKSTNVVFDNLSFSGSNESITVDEKAYCQNLMWINTAYHDTVKGNGALFVTGNIVLNSYSHFKLAGGYRLQNPNTGYRTITSNGADINGDIEINSSYEWRLSDTLNLKGKINLVRGTLNLDNNDMRCHAFLSEGNEIRTLNYSNSVIYLNGSDTAWKSAGSNLALLHDSSSIRLVGAGPDFMLFDAENRDFDTLDIRCPKARIAGGMDCRLFKIRPGTLLECEPLKTVKFDSIQASGSCDYPITIGNYSGSVDTALFMVNSNDTINIINVEHVIISNVCAVSDTGHIYNALNSIGLNKFSGWTITGSVSGNTYYWTGLQSKLWNDRLNWEVNNATALCIPGPMDTVVFDSIHFSVPGIHDTVIVETNAYCKTMTWDSTINRSPALLLNGDLTITGSVRLCDTLIVDYTNNFQPTDINAPHFILSPQNANCWFTPCKEFNVNLNIEGRNISDSVFLLKNLYMDTLSTVTFLSGTFSSNKKNLYAGLITTVGNKIKNVDFSHSQITAAYNFVMQNGSLLNLNMDSSHLVMDDNQYYYNLFDGGGQDYAGLEFRSRAPDTAGVYYKAFVKSSDTFELLKLNPGIHLELKAGLTVAFDSIILNGTCLDSIYLQTTGTASATLHKNGTTGFAGKFLNVKKITATPAGVSALFSKDLGNNSGWVFDTSKYVTSSFSLPATTCFNDSIQFTNLSTTHGNPVDMDFIWSFGDNDSSFTFQPSHLYANNTSYIVTLISTDTATGCFDVYKDTTLTIYKPEVTLNSSEIDNSICLGDSVFFNAYSSNPSPLFYEFIVAGDTVQQSPDSIFATTSLADGDEIFVILTYQGCADTSNHVIYTVNSLPVVHLASNDPDTTICAADTIIFTGSGADKYQLYRNDTAYGAFSTSNQWIIPAPGNGQQFTVYGQNTTTGCSAGSTDTLTVTVHPLPDVAIISSDADLSICYGTPVVFTASGANLYQFSVNGMAQGIFSSIDTTTLTTLSNGDNVMAAGISSDGCMAFSDDYLEFTVMPTPVVSLTSSDPDNIICSGDLINFQAFGADQYQFSVDGNIIGPYSNSDNFSTDSLTNGQVVLVTGTLGICQSQPDSIVMDVRPSISWTFSANEICAGDVVQFTAHGDSLYNFYINGVWDTVLVDGSIYTATGLSNGQQVSVSGTAGACLPSPVTVTVNPLPVAPMACSDQDTTICAGEIITFTGSGADKYQFFVDGDSVGAFSFFSTYSTDSLTNGQVVTMQAMSAQGCTGTSPNSYTVSVNPSPMVVLSQSDPDTTICSGDMVTFTASGADTYEFFISGTSQGAAGPDSVFSSSAIFNGAIITVNGTTGLCTSTSSNIYTYVVTPTPIVTLTALTPLSYCSGDTLRLLAGGATTYEFFVEGISAGAPAANNMFISNSLTNGQTISVAGYQSGCFSPGNNDYTVTVNNYPSAVLSATPGGPAFCYGDTVIFNGSGAQNYIFFVDGIPVSYDSVFMTDALEDGQVVAMRGGNGNCWTDADTTIIVDINYINITLGCSQPSGVICAGDPLTFTANGANLYEFSIDGVSQGSPSASNTFTSASLINGQVVSVEGTSLGTGCLQNAFENILVHVFSVPQITVTPSPTFCEGDSAILESSVTDGLTWYHDGAVITGETSPELHVFTEGLYAVQSATGGNGVVFSAGANYFGQLGEGTLTNALDFKEASGMNSIVEVVCGAEFTLALANDGTVRSWGRNEFGPLGNGNYTDSPLPVAVGNITNATHIAAGKRFGVALLQDSTLVSWGENTQGQLGYGNYSTSNFPFPVIGLSDVTDIAAGDNHCLAVTADGKVWAWGYNHFGQLGDSTLLTRNLPVQVNGLDNVVKVRAGGNHSMALKNDGSLWVWGANNSGQLGNGTNTSSMIPVKVNLPLPVAVFDGGFGHSIAADTAGHVYTWGDNSKGQIGNQSSINALYPVKIIKAGSARQVRAGQYSSYVLRTDDNVFSWGFNKNGQLGQQDTSAVNEPKAITSLFGVVSFDGGNNHCALVNDQEHSCISGNVQIHVDTVPHVPVFLNGLTLYTSAQGTQYQWYYQGSIIPGANDTMITIAAEGSYMVLVGFANGCSAFSDEYSYHVGLEEASQNKIFTLFPNPNQGSFYIQFPGESDIFSSLKEIRITDMPGRIIHCKTIVKDVTSIRIELPGIVNGVYVIELQFNDNSVLRKRFVVEK
ncbi:MAG TPA: PKD domain-containing protein [Paludibacteraceae bacterium]|nr:PKD domain-containing protein [Paludibacteraceae bacterium]